MLARRGAAHASGWRVGAVGARCVGVRALATASLRVLQGGQFLLALSGLPESVVAGGRMSVPLRAGATVREVEEVLQRSGLGEARLRADHALPGGSVASAGAVSPDKALQEACCAPLQLWASATGSVAIEVDGRGRRGASEAEGWEGGRGGGVAGHSAGTLEDLLVLGGAVRLRKALGVRSEREVSLEEFVALARSVGLTRSEGLSALRSLHEAGVVCHFAGHPDSRVRDRVFLRADEELDSMCASLGLPGPSATFAAAQRARKEAELSAIRASLRPLVEARHRAEAVATRSARAMLRGAFAGWSGLIALYTYLTTSVFGWDVVEPLVWVTMSVTSMVAYGFWLSTSRSFQYRDVHTTLMRLGTRNIYRDALAQDDALRAAVLNAVHPRTAAALSRANNTLNSSNTSNPSNPNSTNVDPAALAKEFDDRIHQLQEAEAQVAHEIDVLEHTHFNPDLIAYYDTSGPDTRLFPALARPPPSPEPILFQDPPANPARAT
jgi:Mitochondrial calcium uniporter